jgi:long-chain acyl-CoA synthetase
VTGFFAESWDELPANLLEVSPTFYTSMARVLEKFYTKIQALIDDAPLFQRKLSLLGLRIGQRVSSLKLAGRRVPPMLRAANFLADLVVFRKIRRLFGGKIRFAASGGAPTSKAIIELFHSVGLLVLEQYGSTEAGVLTANTERDYRFGSVGKALSGVSLKIAADDGEILCKGESLCSGYWNDEEGTTKLFRDGWLCTGDIGRIDEDGFLWITDRKKDILITAGGKNVAPANVENLMKTSKYIHDCVVFGDKKPYLVALVTLDEEEITKFARDNRIIFEDFEDLTRKPQVEELIRKTLEDLNHQLPRVAQVKYFRILPEELDIDQDEVTPTMKVKRRIIERRYRDMIESMY